MFFQLWLDVRKQKFDMYKLQNEFFKTRQIIDVYFKTADLFLQYCSCMRDYDNQLFSDRLIMRCSSDFDITLDDKKFLDSLKTTIRHDNLKRAKDSIYDLVYSNDWDFFYWYFRRK